MADRFISTSKLPSPPTRQVVNLYNLSGGLNLWELDYRMDTDQSPEMKNLWWRDGLLSCRDGQEFVSKAQLGTGYCCYEKPFWGHMIAHIGDGLYAAKPGSTMELTKLCSDVPPVRGTFVRYHDGLLYKTRGFFKQILWTGTMLQAQDIVPYVPVTVINCTPEGSGDLYQPENRLSAQKTIWYTAQRKTYSVVFEAGEYTEEFSFTPAEDEPVATVEQVYVGTTLQEDSAYTISEDKRKITFKTAPGKGKTVTIVYTVGVRVYHLPVQEVDSIQKVLVDDVETTDYTVDLKAGTITFLVAPPMQDPPVNNTVKVTYAKENKEAYDAVMDCMYACAYGGTGGAVLILAGSTAQPNAYFWNGSHTAMDMGYFPMSYYNLAGDNLEAVTGFGNQAGTLILFKERAVGKCQMSSTTIDDRAYLSLDYTPINTSIGCDLPWTIRLVENNLVWCNTYTGVCRLEQTTAALENQVRSISRNILGCAARPGLLQAVCRAQTVCALDDGCRYWIAADGAVFLWDYTVSSASKPSWFYFTDIPAVSFFRADDLLPPEADGFAYTGSRPIYHLNAKGQISRFVRSFRDYGGAIEKVYTFATQDFGTMEQQKHIKKLVVATRSDTDTVIELRYDTDHAVRQELMSIRAYSHRLAPRNLAFRFLGVRRFAHVSVRNPGCRYVRHFSLRLYNNEPGCDMSVVSAQIFADLVIKER